MRRSSLATEVTALCVKEDFRGCGIGKRLWKRMSCCVQGFGTGLWHPPRHVVRLRVAMRNPSRGFYEALGLEVCDLSQARRQQEKVDEWEEQHAGDPVPLSHMHDSGERIGWLDMAGYLNRVNRADVGPAERGRVRGGCDVVIRWARAGDVAGMEDVTLSDAEHHRSLYKGITGTRREWIEELGAPGATTEPGQMYRWLREMACAPPVVNKGDQVIPIAEAVSDQEGWSLQPGDTAEVIEEDTGLGLVRLRREADGVCSTGWVAATRLCITAFPELMRMPAARLRELSLEQLRHYARRLRVLPACGAAEGERVRLSSALASFRDSHRPFAVGDVLRSRDGCEYEESVWGLPTDWVLPAGGCATVVEVNELGLVRLKCNSSGGSSGWLNPDCWWKEGEEPVMDITRLQPGEDGALRYVEGVQGCFVAVAMPG